MATRRMFSKEILYTDKFGDLPRSAQMLYIMLGMEGDDDGFVGNPRQLMRLHMCTPEDLETLVEAGYIAMCNGVCFIRDWLRNNTLKNDRYHPTVYQREKAVMQELYPECFHDGSKTDPQQNITEHNETKHNTTKGERRRSAGRESSSSRRVPSPEEELAKLLRLEKLVEASAAENARLAQKKDRTP